MTDPESAAQQRLQAVAYEAGKQYIARFLNNVGRAHGLIELHTKAASNDLFAQHAGRDDILRAAVVFMHASLEELLRELARSFLPLATEAVLNGIPLAGSKSPGRAEKFLLGKLRQHRGKSVDEVIEESVREHLELSNFNGVAEISALLRAADLESADLEAIYPLLAEMMERRHQIVHRADNVESGGVISTRSIGSAQVLRWNEALRSFVLAIAGGAVVKHLIKEGVLILGPGNTVTLRE